MRRRKPVAEATPPVAPMLEVIAAVPGMRGVMLTFEDFVIGMEQFGQRIQPPVKNRARALAA